MSDDLKPCPFCGGEAVLVTDHVRQGYGEYESTEVYHTVKCVACHSSGQSFHQKHLIRFTSYGVQDFRNNPLLRARVEDEYEAYIQQTKTLALNAWERRSGKGE